MPAVKIWQLDNIQDLLIETEAMNKDVESLIRFVENCDGYDSWTRVSLALMKGSFWKDHHVFQAFSAVRKELEAKLREWLYPRFLCCSWLFLGVG